MNELVLRKRVEALHNTGHRGDYAVGHYDAIRAAADIAADGDATIAALRESKDGAYLERNQVVAALAKCFPSGVARTAIEGWSEDWHGCVYIDMPTGQASWHFHDSQAYLFTDLPPYAGKWDGHSTEEKYRRIASLGARDARIAEFEAEQANDTPLQMALDGLRATRERAEKAEAELERERMRLVACGVVALANTPDSAADARQMHADYRSASCDDVAKTVDREMALRAEVARMAAPVGIEPVGSLHAGHLRPQTEPWCKEILLYSPNNGGDDPEKRVKVFPEAAIHTLQARLAAAEVDASTLLEYFEAQRSLVCTLGHEDATAEDEGKAEDRAFTADAAACAVAKRMRAAHTTNGHRT